MSADEPQSLEDLDWYHPNANRHVAESLLMQNGTEGSYLLRPSKSPDTYTLSVRGQDSVKHYTVTAIDGGYVFGLAKFANVTQFLEHFESQPLLGGESGVIVLLKYPYPHHVSEPTEYDFIKVHAQMGRASRNSDKKQALSMGTKEGYLTKQGAIIKNWKMRWFVLKKNELRYYAQRTSPEPIRTLDLRECQQCVQVKTAQQDNCFSFVSRVKNKTRLHALCECILCTDCPRKNLVFPWRTFNIQASTAADASEWIQIINWKLEKLRSRASRADAHS